jgi:hypothetical protein
MQFQQWHCDFSYGIAISATALQFQLRHCNFSYGIAISAMTMQFQKGGVVFAFIYRQQ